MEYLPNAVSKDASGSNAGTSASPSTNTTNDKLASLKKEKDVANLPNAIIEQPTETDVKREVAETGQWVAKSEHELFDWCMQIKHSISARTSLPLQEPLIARLIDNFIKYSPNFSPEFRSYFLVAIKETLENISAKAEFLRRVLFALIDDELIDLDAFAMAVAAADPAIADNSIAPAPITGNQEKPPQINSQVVGVIQEQQAIQNDDAPQKDDVIYNNQHTQDQLDSTSSQQDSEQQIQQRLSQLIRELRNGRIDAFGLRMNLYYWQRLVEQFFQSSANSDNYSTLLQSIRSYSIEAIDPNHFYQQVIHALVTDLPVDMEIFITRTAEDHSRAQTAAPQPAVVATGDAILPANMQETASLHIASTTNEQPAGVMDAADGVNPQQNSNAGQAQYPANENNEYVIGQDATNEQGMHMSQPTNSDLRGSEKSLRIPGLTLEQLLQGSAALNVEQLQQLQQQVNLLLRQFTREQANEWHGVLRNPLSAQRLIQHVPGHLLHQIVQRLQPAQFAALDPIVKLATEALVLLIPNADPLIIKQVRWEFVFMQLFGPPNPLDAAGLLKKCCEQLAGALGFDDSQRLLQLAERRLALLKPVAAARPNMSLTDSNGSAEPELDFEAGIHLNNVGMVLASPFLPRLFSMFNLLEDGKFIHPGAADRAVHLLQYMVTGRSETPEYELMLNKILCGISTSMPISNGIDITEQEKTVIDQMLQSMIQHWRALGSTSVAGLRETFFQRQGWLVLDEEYWRLKVQERTFDMLLDRLPWSISMIKHGWMDKPLRVSWREQS